MPFDEELNKQPAGIIFAENAAEVMGNQAIANQMAVMDNITEAMDRIMEA